MTYDIQDIEHSSIQSVGTERAPTSPTWDEHCILFATRRTRYSLIFSFKVETYWDTWNTIIKTIQNSHGSSLCTVRTPLLTHRWLLGGECAERAESEPWTAESRSAERPELPRPLRGHLPLQVTSIFNYEWYPPVFRSCKPPVSDDVAVIPRSIFPLVKQ